MITRIRIFNGLAAIFALLVATLAGSYSYSAYIESPYLSYENLPFPVTGKVTVGQPVVYPVLRCNSRATNQEYRTTRTLQRMGSGQAPVVLPGFDVTVEPGCRPAVVRMNIIPDGTPPGFYRVYGVATVRGLFVDHQVGWNSDFFEVIEKPVVTPLVIDAVRIDVLP